MYVFIFLVVIMQCCITYLPHTVQHLQTPDSYVHLIYSIFMTEIKVYFEITTELISFILRA